MPSDAFAALRTRAHAGDAAALAFTSVLAALGEGEPQSWPAALERLAHAAELGSQAAQAQLRVLSSEAGEGAAWRACAEAVDLAAWLERGHVQGVSREPHILEAPRFLAPAVCSWLIARARARLSPAAIFSNEDQAVTRAQVRTNSTFGFLTGDLDLVIVLVRAKIAATLGVPVQTLEPTQVLHYAPGQAFHRHYDFLEPDLPAHAAQIAEAGQRKATFLVYLNAGFEGGETEFPLAGLKYKGGVGDAVMFANLDSAGAPDRKTLHAGLPPTSGEKWLLSQWVRDR